MYPQRELIRLAAHKAALRRAIADRRTQCAAVATAVLQPLAWLDRMLVFWRRLAPFAMGAAVPVGGLVARLVFRRRKILSALVHWGPLVFGAVRGLRAATAPPQTRPR